MEKKIKDFKCPHCAGYLNVDNRVALFFENRQQEKDPKPTLVFLDPTPGKYNPIFHPKTVPNAGNVLDFFCTMCGEPIKSQEKLGLCEIDIVAEDGNTGKLYFAPNMGDHATIVVWNEEKKVDLFGKDVEDYSSLFPGFGVHEMNEVDSETSRTTTM